MNKLGIETREIGKAILWAIPASLILWAIIVLIFVTL
jgi:hypothetical protein